MKTLTTFIAVFVIHFSLFTFHSSAQVLCIQCYNQNTRVLTDTNNLIVNGGFENGCSVSGYFCPKSQSYNCNLTNWTCMGGGVNTYAHVVNSTFTTIVEGNDAAYFGNFFCYACSTVLYDTSCFNNIGCQVTGIPTGYPVNPNAGYGGDTGVSLLQTVSGLTVGSIYELEFWAGGEGDNQKISGIFAVDVGFGNIFLRDPPTDFVSAIGMRYIIVFSATSSSQTIKFTNWGHIGMNNPFVFTELILDDVRLIQAGPDENICATSVNDFPKNEVATVFPNPATNQLTVTTTSTQSSEIILFDIASRKLMQEKFSGSATLNIEHLAKGVYLYQMRDDKGMMAQGKVVKE